MKLFSLRHNAGIACGVALLAVAAPVPGADPGLLELDRMQLERAQRSDELRLRLDQDQRSLQLQQEDRQRALQLQPTTPQLTLRQPSDALERKLKLDQQQSQERLSQQLLHQHQLVQQQHLRQSLMSEPDAAAQGRLVIERQRFMRERDAQLRQFGTR